MKIKCRGLSEYIYITTYAIYGFIYLLNSSLLDMGKALNYVTTLATVILLLLILSKRIYKTKELLFGIIVLVCFFIAAHATNRSQLLMFALLIITSNNTSWERALKTSFFTTICSLLYIAFAVKGGKIPDYTYVHSLTQTAHSGGFSYYTTLPYIVLYLILEYLYLRGKKVSWVEIVLLQAMNYWVYNYSTTKLTWILGSIALVLEIVFVKLDFATISIAWIKKVGTVAFPITAMVTYLCCKYYNSNNLFWNALNIALGDRIGLANRAIKEYPITIFGQYIEMYGKADIELSKIHYSRYFYIDSGFIYSILGYGILFTIAVIFMYSFLMRTAIEENDKSLFLWLMVVLVFTVINNTWVSLAMNPILLYFPIALSKFIKNKYERKNNNDI